jgi:L-fucose isomerase
VINQLKNQKYLACGGMSLKMCTTTADVDQWAKLFGITYEAVDQSELTRRAKDMVEWDGVSPSLGKIKVIKDQRVKKAVDFLYKGKRGTFDFTRASLSSIDKFIYQVAYYYAAVDLFTEYGITFAGIKCQDELAANECTQCIAAAYLNNDIGPDGILKPIVPVACENDMDSALTQLWLFLLSNQPSGFGDFRDLENGILAIVNCGQHPPYFFGRPNDKPIEKLQNTEYLGQEYFFHAGGSAVRGRTPGGELMTIARLGRENLRYQLVATVMETVAVKPEDHRKYDLSWPIIWGKIPIPDEIMINCWPCNHLGFTYGDYTPALVELCNRLGIGYRIFDKTGREYFRPS